MTTFSDLIDHAISYLGGDAGLANSDKARRAVVAAYNNLAANFTWSYYRSLDRVVTLPAYAEGSVAYLAAGGVVPRALVLSGGTWPAWAEGASVQIADVYYAVARRLSGSTVQLAAATAPSADLAAGTPYSLWQDSYPLPDGVFKVGELQTGTVGFMQFVSPGQLASLRRNGQGQGTPIFYTVVGIGSPGGVRLRFWPPPDAEYAVDFLSQRMPRPMRLAREERGGVRVAAGSAVVAGVGTLFTADMAGSTFRYSASASRPPVTGADGQSPFTEEGVVLSVEGGQSLTLEAPLTRTAGPCPYAVSDPADIDDDVAGRLILREVEKQCRIIARMKPTESEDGDYRMALGEARAADSRSTDARVAGRPLSRRRRLTDFAPGSEFREGV